VIPDREYGLTTPPAIARPSSRGRARRKPACEHRQCSGTASAKRGPMTPARRVLPGTSYLVTRRCSERRFFLKPCRLTNEIFLYVLAVASRGRSVGHLAPRRSARSPRSRPRFRRRGVHRKAAASLRGVPNRSRRRSRRPSCPGLPRRHPIHEPRVRVFAYRPTWSGTRCAVTLGRAPGPHGPGLQASGALRGRAAEGRRKCLEFGGFSITPGRGPRDLYAGCFRRRGLPPPWCSPCG
jgi:hypothetical protein